MPNRKNPVESAEQDVSKAENQLEAAQVAVVEAHQERAEAQQASAESAQAAVLDQQIVALREAAAPDETRIGYTVGMWAGRPHYLANDGRFDTLDEDAMRAYIRGGGLPDPTPLPRQTV